MKTITVTFVKRYYKAITEEIEIPDNVGEMDEIDFIEQNYLELWNKVDEKELDFEDAEILKN
jgi:hypothetical protein